MKYYKLIQNFTRYGSFFKDMKYPENYVSYNGVLVTDMVRLYPKDWRQTNYFRYGK